MYLEESPPWHWRCPAVSAAAESCPPPPCCRAGWAQRLSVTSHQWLPQSGSFLCTAAPPPGYASLGMGSWNSLERETSTTHWSDQLYIIVPYQPVVRKCKQTHTGQYGASLALLLHVSVFLPWQSERRLEHKAVDVVMPLKICPFVLLFFLIKVGHHVRHLNVGKLGVEVFRIYLLVKNVKQ